MRTWFGRGASLQVAVTSCCLMAFVLFGYDQGVFSGIIQNQNWLDQFGHPNDSVTGIILSSYNLGALAGCIVNFFIGEKLGRRKVIWLAMCFVLVGATLQTSAFTVPHLVVGRIVTGMGTGLKTSTVPMYQSELCDGKSRGRLVSTEVLFVGIGIVTAYWFDFGMSYTQGAIAWRLPVAFQMVFAIFVIIIVFGLPESPRWLLNHNREEEAIEALSAVYDKDPTDEFIVAERDAVIKALNVEKKANEGKSFLGIFQNDRVHTPRRVLLAWGAQFMNQIGGINLVVYYIPTVLVQNVKLSPTLAQILGGCINIMFPVGSIVPSIALDQMGRRKTMILGSTGLGICMLLVSVLLSQASDTTQGKACASASIAFFFLYMLIFGMSMNCVPWVYVPEILPLEARTRGTAVGVSSNWLWNFFIVMITPIIVNRLQWKAYLIFMATNLAFVPLVYFFYPETSNLQLEEVDYIFTQGGDPVKVARRMAKDMKNGKTNFGLDAEIESSKSEKGAPILLEKVD